MRVSTCLYDLQITCRLKYNIEDPAKQNFHYIIEKKLGYSHVLNVLQLKKHLGIHTYDKLQVLVSLNFIKLV
jgi:hypothetical protein